MTEYYSEMLEKGLEFQDFVMTKLIEKLGINLTQYSSKKFQYNIGENKQGIEIKFDDRYEQTGNIYIEIAEKSNKDNKEFIDSGIYRKDNTWIYIIGNYKILYIFSKKYLLYLHKKNIFREVQIPTSKGFLIDKYNAEKYSINIITIE
jgi:hypothetical protein